MFDEDLFGPPLNSKEETIVSLNDDDFNSSGVASLPRPKYEEPLCKQLSRRQSSFLRSRCRDSLNRLNSNSSLFSELDDSNDNSSSSSLKRLEKDDIELGSILGSGGFSNVLSIESSRRKSLFDENNKQEDDDMNNTMNETNDSHIIPEINEDEAIRTINVNDEVTNKLTKRSSYRRSTSQVNRQSSYNRSVSSQSGGSVESYAVKTLRMSIDHNKIIMGAVDLTKEAKWLNVLSHKNIISLHGTGNHPGTVDYFLVIERLQSCVRNLIGKWKTEHQSLVTCGLPKEQVKNSSKRMMLKRMEICYEVCAGLSYLHGKNILFRDMKPDNIGIDNFGIVKIFDFGLAKELKPIDKYNDGPDMYKATRMAGTRRYLSPEVYNSRLYGLPADIYSFTMTLWEVLSLEVPFENMNIREHKKFCYKRKKRPVIKRNWSKSIKNMTKSGWHHNPQKRPKVEEMYGMMKGYLQKEGVRVEIDEK